MKPYLWLLFLIIPFLLIKVTNLGFRLSDTNIYFYTAYQLIQGKLLYKDVFFTNFPFFPYISVIYYFLVGKSVQFYTFTSSIEAILIACTLGYLVYQEKKNILISTTVVALYLFSFIVLTTTEHQTGVFLASLFALLSYLWYKSGRFFFSGGAIALAIFTKAYTLPILISLLTVMLLKRQKHLLPFLGGVALTGAIVLAPTLFFAPYPFIQDVFGYSLTRSQGIAKLPIAIFFLQHDVLLFLLLLSNAFWIKKNQLLGFVSIYTVIFFLFYQDIYYLYLNFVIPFLCLGYPYLAELITKKFSWKPGVIPVLLSLVFIYNLIGYFSSYRSLQKIPQANSLFQTIKTLHPPVIYGPNDIAPLVAYETNTPLLNNIVDTNENLYRKRLLDAKQLTSDALKQHALLISHGAYYPKATFRQDITDGIFDITQLQKRCTLLKSFPVSAEGGINRINLISCQ